MTDNPSIGNTPTEYNKQLAKYNKQLAKINKSFKSSLATKVLQFPGAMMVNTKNDPSTNLYRDTDKKLKEAIIEYGALSTQINNDITNILIKIGKTKMKINKINVKLQKKGVNFDDNAIIAQSTYGLYNDTRGQYSDNRKSNALLFFVSLYLLSTISLNATFFLFFVMLSYITLGALNSSIDIGFIIRAFVILVFAISLYSIRGILSKFKATK